MLKTLIGLILLLIPFLFINRLKNKKHAFFYVFCFLMVFQLFLAVLLQYFGIFKYNIIVIFNIIFCGFIIYKSDIKTLFINLKKIKIDWVLLFTIAVLFIELYSVHFNYTGKAATINDPLKDVKNMKYVYPYYSDEWSAVALIKYSIKTGNLPFANPLSNKSSYFPNPEFIFHSFLSELFMLLNLDPLTSYSVFSIFFGLLVCILVYFVLRVNNLGRFSSAIASLSLPYIVNSANLPGIWYLIPLILGMTCLLLNFVFISIKDNKMVLLSSFLVLLFYPPLFVLSGLSYLFYFISLNIKNKEKIRYIGIFIIICILVGIVISFKIFFNNKGNFNPLEYLFSKFFYLTFTKESIPDYSIWKVVPIWVLLFSFIGFFKFFNKKRWLTIPILIGLVYWFVYSFVLFRFIIEYQRVVVATSILLTILFGFGFGYFIEYIKNKNYVKNRNILKILLIFILIIFFIFSFYYTQNNEWDRLKLYNKNNNLVFLPAPPANNYLHPDDLIIFSNRTAERFIAPPWKGFVIGVSTDNFPLETKSSTITIRILNYGEFVSMDCYNKKISAEIYKIEYAYTPEFNCTNFKEIKRSSEGLILYQYTGNFSG